MQKLFEVEDVVVFEELSAILQNLMDSKPRKHQRKNTEAKTLEDLLVEKPKPMVKPKISRLPYISLYFCERCGVFYKGI